MNVLGIDGTPSGWVGIQLVDGEFAGADLVSSLEALVVAHPGADVIAIDMPIGLLERGWRDCDQAAREALGARRSSVFPIPPRPVVEEPDYDRAKELCAALTGKKFSKQAFNLFPKIREVNALADRDARLHEVHPELTFQAMAGGAPLGGSKKTWTGIAERTLLLRQHGIEVPPLAEVLERVPADDVLDAAAAAWSAQRIHAGQALAHPAPPTQFRAAGQPIVIQA